MNLFRINALLYSPSETQYGKCPKCRMRRLGARYVSRSDTIDYYCHACAYTYSGPVAAVSEAALKATSGKHE